MTLETTITPERALLGLLALGGLDYDDILRYTGWPAQKADEVLAWALTRGLVSSTHWKNQHGSRYWLAEDDRPEPRQPCKASSHSATFLSSERSRNSFSWPAGTSRTA